jgi:hypothetical protein
LKFGDLDGLSLSCRVSYMLGADKEKRDMPTYNVFKGSTGAQKAITVNKTGSKLPKRQAGNWVYEKDIRINPGGGPLIGADSEAIIAGVTKDGYYLWPQPKTP